MESDAAGGCKESAATGGCNERERAAESTHVFMSDIRAETAVLSARLTLVVSPLVTTRA